MVRVKNVLKKVVLYGFLLTWGFIALYPVVWMFYTSVKLEESIYVGPFSPPGLGDLTVSGWAKIMFKFGGLQAFFNSLIIAVGATVCVMTITLLAGYALARYEIRGHSYLLAILLGMIAIPLQANWIPIYLQLQALGLLNTHLGIIIPLVGGMLPFLTLVVRAYFRSFPKEVEEAARLDGASELRIFLSIVVPIARPILAVVAILAFPGAWNDLLFPMVVLTDPSMKPLPKFVLAFRTSTSFTQEAEGILSLTFAGMAFSTLPLVIFYLLFQRYIIRGIAIGAVKG